MVPRGGNGLSGLALLAVVLGSCATNPSAVSESDLSPAIPTTTEPAAAENVLPDEAAAPSQDPVVLAATPVASKVLFACRTAQNKVIELYDRDAVIQYVFGPPAQVELVLDVPREQTSTFQWHGIGRYENYSVSIPNGNTVYSVYWSRDRLDVNYPPEAGVTVEIDGDYVATVNCASEITNNLIGVDLPPTPL